MKRYNNFKIQYFAVFIFLALMLFVKPDKVFAAKTGGSTVSNQNYNASTPIPSSEFDGSGGGLGQRLAQSYGPGFPSDCEQYVLGYKADFMQAGSTDGKSQASGYFGGGTQTYSITGKAMLIAFPKIVTFNELSTKSRQIAPTTGYLYLFMDESELKEQMQINTGLIEQDLMPLYFTDKKSEGEAVFSIPAFACYLPLSNIKGPEGYYSQSSSVKTAEEKMITICRTGEQDLSNWSCWNDGTGFLVGDSDQVIPSQYKWAAIFANVQMQDNFTSDIGQAYIAPGEYERYPVDANNLASDINNVRTQYPEYAKYVTKLSPSSLQKQKGYFGFKENSTAIGGLDTYWQIAGNNFISRQLKEPVNSARIVNAEKILKQAYSSLTAGGSLNMLDENRAKIDAKQMAQIFNNIANSAESAGSLANFISYNGGHYVPRYQWSAELGVSPNNCIDAMFSKDTNPLTTAYGASGAAGKTLYMLLDNRFTTSTNLVKTNRLTNMFSSYMSDNWNGMAKEDKIESTAIMISFVPDYVIQAAAKVRDVQKYLGGAKGADAIKKLNELGKTDYKSWMRCMLAIGDHLANHTATSTPPNLGWTSQSAFLTTTGSYYSIQSYGISIVVSPHAINVEDLILSNSYGTGINTSEDAAYGSVAKSPEARNTIDWTPLVTSGLNLSGLKKGGKSTPAEPENTVLKKQSQYFDIYCGIRSISGAGQLAPDTDNIAAVGRSAGGKGTSNNSQIRTYSQNPAQHKFTTVFFVGRIPEADSEVEVKVSDMVPTVFASFNKFDLVWDAGFDDNASGRATVSINMSENKGTAQSALSSAIYAFSGDYNGSYLVNNYWAKGLSKSYNEVHNWEFGVTAKPLGILECDQKSLLDYAIPEYMTKGPEATGYSNIKMAGSFKSASEATKVNPGDVVAYTFDYAFPKNQSVLKSNIGRLVEDGTWYTEYETLLMADLNIELLPSNKLKESEWEDINSNTGNDWVKERLVAPVLHNVFFTEIKVDAVGGESFSKTGRPSSDGADYISQTKLTETDFGIPWLVAPAGGRDEFGNSFTSNTIYKHYYDLKPNKSTTNYSLSKVTVKFSWEYVTTLPITSSNINIANQIKYSNGLNRTAGIITGSQIKKDWTGQATDYMGFEYNGNIITIDPNQDILNFGKGNTVTLDVPNSSVNEFHGDWEHIVIAFNAPPKDNSVDDLVLLYNNSQLVGEANINRLNGGGAQAIDYKEGGSYTLYAIVRRNKPDFSWEEKVDGRKWSGDTVGCFEYATNENASSHSKMVSHAETSIPGAARTIPMVIRNITSFKNPGDTLIFKVNLPSNLMYLEATFHYRDAYVGEDSEDIDLENNVWSESWSAKYPDFAVEINQDFKSVFEKGGCGAQRTVVPNYTIIATQSNPFYEGGGGPVTIDTSLGGWTVASGTTSGNRITWYWGGGMEQNSYHITYKERRFPYQSPTFNQEFVFRAHINPEVRYNEKNLNNNYAKANFSVTLDCQDTPRTSIPPCTPEDWERLDCKYKYGVGKQYRWNVKFAWSQQNPEKTTSTNVYVQHYMEDVYGSDGNGGSIYLGQREVCPCYCDPSPVSGPNNGVRFWRTEIDGAPLYYEVHTMQIYLKSTNKATQWGWEDASVYDITGGTGYVSGGMMWNVFFDARYDSDRGSMPRSMYSPFSQPYATGNGGSGCPTCNWLNRWPNPENVQGPRHVLIKYRGLLVIAPKDYEYSSPQQVLANGLVNKHFRWQPISGMMAMPKENIRQTLNISITSYGFTGHIFDTWNSVDGTGWSPPGYAWQNATFHCFCDTVSATVEFIPPRPYIASAVAVDEHAQGVDGDAPGKGEKVGQRDTGVEGTDNMETDDEQWIY